MNDLQAPLMVPLTELWETVRMAHLLPSSLEDQLLLLQSMVHVIHAKCAELRLVAGVQVGCLAVLDSGHALLTVARGGLGVGTLRQRYSWNVLHLRKLRLLDGANAGCYWGSCFNCRCRRAMQH